MAQEGLSALQIAASTWVPVEGIGVRGAQLVLGSSEPLQAGAGWVLSSCLSPALALHPPGHVPGSLWCPGHGTIGLYDLLAVGAGVFELLGFTGTVEVPPHAPQVSGDPKATVVLAHDLQAQIGQTCLTLCQGGPYHRGRDQFGRVAGSQGTSLVLHSQGLAVRGGCREVGSVGWHSAGQGSWGEACWGTQRGENNWERSRGLL